ncbi:hypothetical protein AVEN_176068-1 [Araneus ventricosus]|uniref:Uncharacterized protein n=1 Tax=Araneus ventricosus TaxID=182803 RepID=A0A4Y2F9U3_ARAVE|nr:hypothetical protein AVEN_176068-1 [Araneus ventricosus]
MTEWPFEDLPVSLAGKEMFCLDSVTTSRLKMKIEILRGGRGVGWEEVGDFETCLKTNSGTSVKDLSNFSTKIKEYKPVVRTYGLAFFPYECPA